jgi:hypothetical protein
MIHSQERKKEDTSSHGENLADITLDSPGTSSGAETSKDSNILGKVVATIHCLADFAIYPLGTKVPFQRHIDEIEKVLKRCGKFLFCCFDLSMLL